MVATLPADNHIRLGVAPSAKVQQFLSKHSLQEITPLYPSILQTLKEKDWSEAQFAEHIRQGFPRRTAHQPRRVPSPEISRTYVFEIKDASPA
jgi:hypothetical protein